MAFSVLEQMDYMEVSKLQNTKNWAIERLDCDEDTSYVRYYRGHDGVVVNHGLRSRISLLNFYSCTLSLD